MSWRVYVAEGVRVEVKLWVAVEVVEADREGLGEGCGVGDGLALRRNKSRAQ